MTFLRQHGYHLIVKITTISFKVNQSRSHSFIRTMGTLLFWMLCREHFHAPGSFLFTRKKRALQKTDKTVWKAL